MAIQQHRRILIRYGTAAVLAGYGVVLAVLFSVIDFRGFSLGHPVVGWLPLAMLLTLANYVLRGIRFHRLMRSQTDRLAPMQAVGVFLAGLTFAATPGRVGDLVRVLLLRRWHGIRARTSFPICLFDRFFDMAAVCLLILLSAGLDGTVRAAYPEWWAIAAATAAITAGLLALLAALRAPGRLPRPVRRSVRMLRFRRPIAAAVPAALALSVAAWACEGVTVTVIVLGFGAGFSIAAGVFTHGVALLGGALTFLPGGVFGAEAALVLLLGRIGLGLPDAVVATLLVRLVTFWLAIVLGACTWFVLGQRYAVRSSLASEEAA